MNGDSEARAYTEDERDRWDLPNYGLPKTLPIKLDEVIIVVLHALRFALYLGLSGLRLSKYADLTLFFYVLVPIDGVLRGRVLSYGQHHDKAPQLPEHHHSGRPHADCF